ncbi:hypothetical protein BLD49_17430 [Erwinia sp. OLMDSP33]|nr:hypothetical protein BLD47_17600 [Erwinia sp. OLCASP19]PIJ79503.1 hypothetical protein BLD49_17430 [Erwinia sp. OLMDSP33]
MKSLHDKSIHTMIFSPHIGKLRTLQGTELNINGTIEGNPSVLVDAVIVPDGKQSIDTLLKDGNAKYYLLQAFKHLKVIGLQGEAQRIHDAIPLPAADEGMITGNAALELAADFIEAMKLHRVWSREMIAGQIPA